MPGGQKSGRQTREAVKVTHPEGKKSKSPTAKIDKERQVKLKELAETCLG